MSKRYLTINKHNFNGDFYCGDNGIAFRADNLAIATKIAFNRWLRDFDPLNRECSLVSISDGSFTVLISERGETRTETHHVSYHGPADQFTVKYIHQHAEQWHAERYAEMERLTSNGDPRVRLSKRSGLVMFNIHFPRYDKNGEWWCGDTYLSDDKTLADQQWEYALADDKTRKQIATRNYEAFTQKQMEITND